MQATGRPFARQHASKLALGKQAESAQGEARPASCTTMYAATQRPRCQPMAPRGTAGRLRTHRGCCGGRKQQSSRPWCGSRSSRPRRPHGWRCRGRTWRTRRCARRCDLPRCCRWRPSTPPCAMARACFSCSTWRCTVSSTCTFSSSSSGARRAPCMQSFCLIPKRSSVATLLGTVLRDAHGVSTHSLTACMPPIRVRA